MQDLKNKKSVEKQAFLFILKKILEKMMNMLYDKYAKTFKRK